MNTFPRMRPIADTGVLVEFGDQIDDQIHAKVMAMDDAIQDVFPKGVTETVPAYTSLLIHYDPLKTNYDELQDFLGSRLKAPARHLQPQNWRVPVCYEAKFAPDLESVSDQLDITVDAFVDLHSSATYKVYMYGFAPGYAYLGGVPKELQLPRKSAHVSGVPPRSLIIAGPQALITTVTMPTGWWGVGKSGINPLDTTRDNPFLFSVGDTVSFEPMSLSDFEKYGDT